MFCPGCGLEDRHANQFCRACGTDLRPVRLALEKPDNITASAVTARDEIGRAMAAKIREMQSAKDLATVVECVLPKVGKFLESPEERRMRRIRAGTITSSIGIGVAAMFLLMLSNGSDALLMIGAGLIAFFIGLGMILNGLFFTVPKKSLSDKSSEAENQHWLDAQSGEFVLPEPNQAFASVTEHTTHQLKEKQPMKS
jgi:hypothetical protein